MAQTIRNTSKNETGKDTRIIDNLVHEIQNDLQVISMEANLQLIEKTSKRGPQCAIDATQHIEKLLGEVRQYFLLSQ